jgi:ribonuclease HII
VLDEAPRRSSYRVRSDGKAMDITFAQSADSEHMAVALASMYSKYVRELFMKLENRFWASHVPDLKPTAGYPQDARRFLTDIEDACERLDIPWPLLVRSR